MDLHNYPQDIASFFQERVPLDYTRIRRLSQEAIETWQQLDQDQQTFAWVLGKSGLPWLPLAVDLPRKEMLEEALKVRDLFVSHRYRAEGDYETGNRGWKVLSLHGLGPTHTRDPFAYGYLNEGEAPYRWTEVAKLCPRTTEFFLDTYPCEIFYRVRYSMLEPGGFILPHVDRKESMLWEVNLALNNPVGFEFGMADQGLVPFNPGRAFILDVSHEHSVLNTSTEDRIHMIVHGYPLRDKPFQDLILKSFLTVEQNLSLMVR